MPLRRGDKNEEWDITLPDKNKEWTTDVMKIEWAFCQLEHSM